MCGRTEKDVKNDVRACAAKLLQVNAGFLVI
jgi:hypothetical protein